RHQRTTLVNAANAQLLRLFCAQHVLDEVVKHSADWTGGTNVTPAEFLRRWLLEYLPVIRFVQTDAIADMLDRDEAGRVEALAAMGSADVPSVSLALAIGGMYLSGDWPAMRAVYGPDLDVAEHERWVDV